MTTRIELNEQGVGHNEWSLELIPNSVIIRNNTTELKIPMRRFRQFAEWYLEDQSKEQMNE
jgi:hypothetical protein